MAQPPLLQFDEVDVVPTTGFAKHIATGGPVWPEFEQQVDARHCRGEVPVDSLPARRDAVARIERLLAIVDTVRGAIRRHAG